MAIITRGLARPNIEELFDSDFVDKENHDKKVVSGEDFITQYSIEDFPVDIEEFSKKIGIEIKYANLENGISGKLEKDGEHYIITVENRHPKNRQRFTIAHEIAHYFLHRNLKEKFEDIVFFRGVEKDSTEFQANLFASEILMPKNQFLEQIKIGKNKIEDLAKYFGVSTLAIRVRAKQLNLKGHGL